MNRVKIEHFVPQSYLKFFATSKKKNKKVFQTIVYDKLEDKFYPSNIDSVAGENKYFDLPEVTDDNGLLKIARKINDNQDIEKFFSTSIEVPYKKYLDNIRSVFNLAEKISGTTAISDYVKKNLSLYLIIQFLRTRYFRDQVNHLEEKFTQMVFDKYVKRNTPDSNTGSNIKIEIPEERSKVFQASMIFNPGLIADSSMHLYKHCWIVLVNKSDLSFITSDNPIVKIPHKKDEFMSYSGLASEGIEIAFPISPTLLLVMYDRSYHKRMLGYENQFLEINENLVIENYNKAQFLQAKRQVFSNDNNIYTQIKKWYT